MPDVCLPPARSLALGTTVLLRGGEGNVPAFTYGCEKNVEVCLS
jgi:hypothetical protein